MSTAEQKLAAIAAVINGTAAPAAAAALVADIFWLPSAEERSALAASGGLTLGQVDGWDGSGENTAQAKLPPLSPMPAFVSGDAAQFAPAADVLRYAGCGYRPDGSHWLWQQAELSNARSRCSKLHLAADAAAMDAVVAGAGAMDRDAAELAVMTGLLPGNPIPKIAVGSDGFLGPVAGQTAVTVEDVTLYLSQPVPQPWG